MPLFVRVHSARLRLTAATLLTGTALSVVAPAWAETLDAEAAPATGGLQEIIVTAERREADVQKVPISIGVLDSTLLGQTGFVHLLDADKAVAGVTFFRGAANQQASVIIRGVGTTNQGYTQAVGIYVDDVPLIRSVAAGQWDLPDIERIEVLRGPQGTLYGQNSTAGAVKIVSRDPGQKPEGWVSVGLGNYMRSKDEPMYRPRSQMICWPRALLSRGVGAKASGGIRTPESVSMGRISHRRG
ncbi:TonB-dependent receptor [Tsuneonella sp. CC-YZS046]|uniref:TonB-dependent receptor n=1 Tax=Tsuneonella sp. CC-YZS046 TaxID=3042152 RepID=UPI002D764B7D|nr:TonB-dependent receptor [Tsuneonella sp. CC-YZS046]WRO66625.1 TonB-dependent receptor [Tsuneonella sp. CC-YZS046]